MVQETEKEELKVKQLVEEGNQQIDGLSIIF